MANKEVIVVTGSSGRIGTRVIERLKERCQPVGIDFIGITSKAPEMEFVFVDLSSDESVDCAFDRIRYAYGNRIASIVHLAAFYSFSGKGLENYDRITVKGTGRLLSQAKKFEIEQFLFTSTMLVHDPSPRGVKITEDSPIHGKWHYPASKVRTEKLIHEQRGSVPTVVLRIAGCYDDQCNCVPLSQHMSRIYEKQFASLVFPGNSDNGVCYIHFDDLIDMIALCIDKRKELDPEVTLLACEEDSVTYRELQTKFGKLLHNKDNWPMVRVPKWFAKFGAFVLNLVPFGPPPFIKPWMVNLADDNYEVSMKKAKEVLGWQPKRNLPDSLPKMAKNLLEDPVAWYKRHGIPVPHVAKKAKEHA